MVESKQVAFRFPLELIARIEAYAARVNEKNPGLKASLADVVRVLLTKALDAEGVAAPQSTKRSKKS